MQVRTTVHISDAVNIGNYVVIVVLLAIAHLILNHMEHMHAG